MPHPFLGEAPTPGGILYTPTHSTWVSNLYDSPGASGTAGILHPSSALRSQHTNLGSSTAGLHRTGGGGSSAGSPLPGSTNAIPTTTSTELDGERWPTHPLFPSPLSTAPSSSLLRGAGMSTLQRAGRLLENAVAQHGSTGEKGGGGSMPTTEEGSSRREEDQDDEDVSAEGPHRPTGPLPSLRGKERMGMTGPNRIAPFTTASGSSGIGKSGMMGFAFSPPAPSSKASLPAFAATSTTSSSSVGMGEKGEGRRPSHSLRPGVSPFPPLGYASPLMPQSPASPSSPASVSFGPAPPPTQFLSPDRSRGGGGGVLMGATTTNNSTTTPMAPPRLATKTLVASSLMIPGGETASSTAFPGPTTSGGGGGTSLLGPSFTSQTVSSPEGVVGTTAEIHGGGTISDPQTGCPTSGGGGDEREEEEESGTRVPTTTTAEASTTITSRKASEKSVSWSSESSTEPGPPLISWKCGLCGYHLLSMDQFGKPLPLSRSAYGEILPICCPRCQLEHTGWEASTPFDALGEHVNMRSTLLGHHTMLSKNAPMAMDPRNDSMDTSSSLPTSTTAVEGGGEGSTGVARGSGEDGRSSRSKTRPPWETAGGSGSGESSSMHTSTPQGSEKSLAGGGYSSAVVAFSSSLSGSSPASPHVRYSGSIPSRVELPPILANIGKIRRKPEDDGETCPLSSGPLSSHYYRPSASTSSNDGVMTPAPSSKRAFYCGLCGRRLLRMDSDGELVAMDVDADGKVLPIRCPGCLQVHNKWEVRPFLSCWKAPIK